VLKYLARYTHRVAISNGRLLSLDNGQGRFRWRDSRHNNRSSVMKLDAVEFVRRFLLHVLPAGFVKIRHFGLLANRNRRQALALCRLRLCTTAADPGSLLTEQQKSALSRSCPQCRSGTLHVVARGSAVELPRPSLALHCAAFDSS
jgi:Putative transposase